VKISRHIFGALIILMYICQPVQAVKPEKVEALVYKYQAFNGAEHKITYSPPAADAIYLIANTDNTFDPRYTLVYYWPLTQEYFQAWERLDVPVFGKLDIMQEGQLIQQVNREKIVLFYPNGPHVGGSKVLKGKNAVAKSEEYKRIFNTFKTASATFYAKMMAYELSIRELMRQSPQGDAPLDLPPKPIEPNRPRIYVSEYHDEMVINLPAGNYTMQMRDDDNLVVEGSQRDILVFESLGEVGVGYELIPEERWTKRLSVFDPQGGIYAQTGKVFYLVPYRTEAYDENNHNRLLNPQKAGRKRIKKWIQREYLESGQLVLMENDRIIERLERKKFYVEQIKGAELGYTIKSYTEDKEASQNITFEAFYLKFNGLDHGKLYTVALLNEANGEIYNESKREIRVIGKTRMTVVWATAFLPCIAGLLIHSWRKRKKVKPWEKD
jgi:hypothetical protein